MTSQNKNQSDFYGDVHLFHLFFTVKTTFKKTDVRICVFLKSSSSVVLYGFVGLAIQPWTSNRLQTGYQPTKGPLSLGDSREPFDTQSMATPTKLNIAPEK